MVAAVGGQAGLDAFSDAQRRQEPFAVVITYLGMPRVDGRTVAAAVKAAEPATPVILPTGWGQDRGGDLERSDVLMHYKTRCSNRASPRTKPHITSHYRAAPLSPSAQSNP